MITAGWCTMMVEYNSWQNRQLADLFYVMTPTDLERDQGAFFRSILGTANHLLWGDGLWMARFDGGARAECTVTDSADLCATAPDWAAARRQMDDRISHWASSLRAPDLDGDLSWFSGVYGCHVTKPLAQCVTHMFNHQTHHRGQIHAMLTASGSPAPVSDLAFMPGT